MTVQPTRDQLLDMTENLRVLGDRPELCDEVVDGLWAALAQAEHRIARLEAQTSIRGRAVVMYRDRAREAEADRDWSLRSSRIAKKERIEANARAERAEARIAEEKRLRMEATAAATQAEARIKRLENRAASETARANEWRRKHRVMAGKRDAARRAWFEEAKARREAETRVQAVRDVLDAAEDRGPIGLTFDGTPFPAFVSSADIRRALDA